VNHVAIYLHKKTSFVYLTHLQFCAASIEATSECLHWNKSRKTMYCCHEQISMV